MTFWTEHPEWAAPKPKSPRAAPKCKTHGLTKARATAKSRYRCPECEREAWERGEC